MASIAIFNERIPERDVARFALGPRAGRAKDIGFRVDGDGKRIPRDLVRKLTCRYNGEFVFAAELFPATAGNPFFSFHTAATGSGTIAPTWEGDNGFAQTETVAIRVA